MPRPGPRPYECVRRAWHSDRHQPMRGSIIQQIFRLVTETHSPATKKNKEWQEKLPIVVLKSEEIMYSKANSEAEYTNLETLWDRANDAINTIIRRDESTETGELLPPCVEAALNLGCIAVRASRSQRHSNPRMYLSPRAQEPASVAPPRILDETNERCPQLSPLNSGNQLNYARGTTAASSARLPAESNRYATENRNLTAPHSNPLLYENIPQGHNQLMGMEGSTPLNLGSVYPLYYGAHCQTEPSRLGSQIAEDTNHRPIFLGTPVGTSIVNCPEIGILQNFFSCSSPAMVSRATGQADARDTPEKPLEEDCDLSLRLSLSSHPCMRVEKSSTLETEDVGSSSSEGGKSSMPCLQKNKEFSFFPGKPVGDPFDSSLGKWLSEGECHNSEGSVRKRKAPFSDNLEDSQFCSQPELPSNWFINRIKGPGL